MTVDIDFIITNSANGNQYLFRGVNGLRNPMGQVPLSIPLIQGRAADNIIFRFTGQIEELSFNFYIFDDGVDVSNGTGSSINSIKEQVSWLKNNVFTHEFDTSWILSDTNAISTPSGGITCVIVNIETPRESGVPGFLISTITVLRGRIAGI